MDDNIDVFSSRLMERMTDEELIIRIRGGEEVYRTVLFARYHRQREARLRALTMVNAPCLNDWHKWEVYFRVLSASTRLFAFGNGAKFSTYFTTNLIRELIHEFKHELRFVETIGLRLDESHSNRKESLMHEVLSSGVKNEPVEYVEERELRESLEELPASFHRKTKRLLALMSRGYNLSEASRLIGEKPNTTRLWIKKLREHVYANFRRTPPAIRNQKRRPRGESVVSSKRAN